MTTHILYAIKPTEIRTPQYNMKNPWNTLGLSPAATPEEIKRAYRKLAAIHHPDRGGNKDKFDELQKAYDLLNNPAKRRDFDRSVNEKPISKLSVTVHEVVDGFWKNITKAER